MDVDVLARARSLWLARQALHGRVGELVLLQCVPEGVSVTGAWIGYDLGYENRVNLSYGASGARLWPVARGRATDAGRR